MALSAGSTISGEFKEKRIHPRKKAYLPVSLYPHAKPLAMDTLTKDISGEGVRCISQTATPNKSTFRIEIHFPSGNQESLTLQGQQKWSRPIPGSEQLEIGIAFMDIPPALQERFGELVDALG